jgi:hypothetical protein
MLQAARFSTQFNSAGIVVVDAIYVYHIAFGLPFIKGGNALLGHYQTAAFRELDGLTSLASTETKGVGTVKLLNAPIESQTERIIGLLEPWERNNRG